MPALELVALLSACKERPEENAPRLVLADWLEEHGQPQRAELIRLQVELARSAPWERGRAQRERRVRELTRAHAVEWLGGLAAHLDGWEFRRGLVWGRGEVRSHARDPLAG